MPNDRSEDARSRSTADSANDSDASYQEELRREAAEGKGLPGDMTSNGNLSGSSTWETLDEPDGGNDASGGSNVASDR